MTAWYRSLARLPETKAGAFTQVLYDEAKKNGWIVISMKRDWREVFSFTK